MAEGGAALAVAAGESACGDVPAGDALTDGVLRAEAWPAGKPAASR
jgi:hypothetical protein